MYKHKKIYLLLAIVFVLFLVGRIVWAACVPGNHNVRGWGWNPYVGWISLSCANEEAPSGFDFGVNVDVGTGEVTGYAWNNWGPGYWICFGTDCSGYGEIPGGGSPWASYNSGTGQITGWAKFIGWGEDGWIQLTTDYGETTFRGDETEGTFGGAGDTWETPLEEADRAWNPAIGWIQWVPIEEPTEEFILGATPSIEPCPTVILSWTDAGADTYEIYRCDYDCPSCIDENYINIGNTVELTYTDGPTGLLEEHTYCYKVKAITGEDEVWNDNGGISVTTPDCEEAPEPGELSAESPRCGEIELNWGEVSGANSYNIYKTLNSNGCNVLTAETCYQIATGVTAINYTDTAVIPRIDYYYRVTSIISIENPEPPPDFIDQESEPSNYASARTVCFPGSEWEER